MTIHISTKKFFCPKCSVELIPFKINFKCPNCGESVGEFLDFVAGIFDAMDYHKEKYGNFMPPAWYTGSLVDHVSQIVFRMFDAIEAKKPDNPELFIKEFLDKGDWSGYKYRHKHTEEIALAVLLARESGKSLEEIAIKQDPSSTPKKGIKRILQKLFF